MHAYHPPLRPAFVSGRPLIPQGSSSSALSSDRPHLDGALSGNRLLAALPAADWDRWSAQLERVELRSGQVLYESGRSVSHVYFPTTAIVSLLNLTSDGSASEVASVGNDGVVGVPVLMQGLSTNGRAVVQSAGRGYRLAGDWVIHEFNRGGAVMHLLLRYTQALLTQVVQTATCVRHHSIDQQICRWILLSLDRAQGNGLRVTHEGLAAKMGVRRESVTSVTLALRRAGLIGCSRGHIEVLDRAGLEQRVCECYGVVKLECDRLLPQASEPADDSDGRPLRRALPGLRGAPLGIGTRA